MYTARSVQERGTAAQHLGRHGEHGFGCLPRRGNRDLFSRYRAVDAADAADADDDDDDEHVTSGEGSPPTQEVTRACDHR